MISLRWIPIFVLGACAGYGVALYFPPEELEVVLTKHKPREADLHPDKSPSFQVNAPGPQQATLQTRISRDAKIDAAEGGELAEIKALMETKEWVKLIQLATTLISQDETRQEELWPYLERAYVAIIKAALDQQAYNEAHGFLVEADAQLGASAPRLILLAELSQMRGDLNAARTSLHQAITIDPSYGEMVYPLIRQVVIALTTGRNSSMTFEEKAQILTDEIINDANFAEYYAILGRLYYQEGSYEEAIANLNYALQLDHTAAAKLSPLIDAAQQRLHTAGLVEVPITSQGQMLNVDVRLNDAGRDFHFILDTGASFTAITSKTAQALNISIAPDQPTIQISTANGMISVPAVTLKAVNLKGALAEDVQAVVLDDLNGYDGLLGLSFLNHFNIDINHSEGKLFISEH